MTTEPQNDNLNKLNALVSRLAQLETDGHLSDTERIINDISSEVSRSLRDLLSIRSRGYVFAPDLESMLTQIGDQWRSLEQQLGRDLQLERSALRTEAAQAGHLIRSAQAQSGNMLALVGLLPQAEREVGDLDTKIKAAEQRLKAVYADLETELRRGLDQMSQIAGWLDLRDEASFPFAEGENVYMAAEAEWVVTGKGGEDPDGILFLTDKRLAFEQKEKTGKKLGLFGGKQTHELKWQVPLSQVTSVEPENKGLFGGKDILQLTLAAGAPHSAITLEVKGRAKSAAWAEEIQRAMQGNLPTSHGRQQ